MSAEALPQDVLAEERPRVIEASRGWGGLGLGEAWRYRELLFFLAWRDLKVRYKQTVLGVAWAVLQPLLTMIVFALLFGRLLEVPTDGIPQPVFYYSGVLIWGYFAGVLIACSSSLVASQSLIKKVYFPRLVIPLSATLVGLVDFAIAFTVLLGLMAYFTIWPAWSAVLLLPALLLFALLTAVAIGLWAAALNVRYRDVRYTVPFVVQLWMFATPVVYPASVIPERWKLLYGLNPMTGVVEGFRWCLVGRGSPPGGVLWVSLGITLLLLVSGLAYFRRVERTLADVV